MVTVLHVSVPPRSFQTFPLTRVLNAHLNVVVQEFVFVHLIGCIHHSDIVQVHKDTTFSQTNLELSKSSRLNNLLIVSCFDFTQLSQMKLQIITEKKILC